jgi:hypothetical protein
MKRRYAFHLDVEQLAQLKDLAGANGMSVSENIRRAIQARIIANGHLLHRGALQRAVKDIREAGTLERAMELTLALVNRQQGPK